uniref:Uncharacterized protein n=1 Tax=Anguilla anguilla TaxID=7936 RepID=A0A0E9REP3_ANGAN
MALYSQTVKVQ